MKGSKLGVGDFVKIDFTSPKLQSGTLDFLEKQDGNLFKISSINGKMVNLDNVPFSVRLEDLISA